MKRALPVLFALTLSFVFACNPQPATNGNKPGNANRSEGITAAATVFPVVITLATKQGTDTFYLSVAPETVTINEANGDQIEWIVSNPFPDVSLSNVRITDFKGGISPNTDPFANGGTFTFAFVAAQSVAEKLSGNSTRYGSYEYKVFGTVTRAGGPPMQVSKDPRVIITG